MTYTELVEKYVDWQCGETSQSSFLIACYEKGLTDEDIKRIEEEGDELLYD